MLTRESALRVSPGDALSCTVLRNGWKISQKLVFNSKSTSFVVWQSSTVPPLIFIQDGLQDVVATPGFVAVTIFFHFLL